MQGDCLEQIDTYQFRFGCKLSLLRGNKPHVRVFAVLVTSLWYCTYLVQC